MNDETNTIELKTPAGKAVTLRKFFTARQRNELRGVYLKHLKVNPQGGAAEMTDIGGEVVEIAERKLLELAVVSYDGITENVIDALLDTTPSEYDFIVAEAGKVDTGFLAQTKQNITITYGKGTLMAVKLI